MSSRSRHRKLLVVWGAAGVLAAGVVSPHAAGATRQAALGVTRPVAGTSAHAVPGSHPAHAARVPGGDEVVTGVGDIEGYHLYAASSADGWAWHWLATLRPADADQAWIGQQCLTGDGRSVVAVVAPWAAANSEAGMNVGGYAFAVDAHTGAVRPLATGASLAYFDPGCGSGSTVALTSFLGAAQRPSRVTVVDAGTGKVSAITTVSDEVTSAVPAGGRIVAARGNDLVDVSGGRIRVLAHFPDATGQLAASGDGGVDLLSQGARTSQVWHWSPAGTRRLGGGPVARVHLFPGAGGHTVVVGAGRPDTRYGMRVGHAPGDAEGSSAEGGAVLTAARTQLGAGARVRPQAALAVGAAATPVLTALPAPAGTAATAAPTLNLLRAAATLSAAAATTTTTPPATTAYACSVPRNDINKQVWQPTSDQVRWAVNQAVQGAFGSGRTPGLRPSAAVAGQLLLDDAAGTALPRAYADVDFPLVSGAPAVPPLVMYAILAQESNFNQASWHAAVGRAGNPVIANYYGATQDGPPIDYGQSDCGYGIAQITDGMKMPSSGQPTAVQVRVATDYATDIAAAVRILQSKWVALRGLKPKMTVNNDDPTKLENWYTAIWAYNSGVYTDTTTRTGLGWHNNPANKLYPYPRHPFLHGGTTQTYGDASHPNDWPYQERVFGWMEVPLVGPDGYLAYRGTYDWDSGKGGFLSLPTPLTFCSATVNSCDLNQLIAGKDPCPAESVGTGSACWWNQPVSWVDCTKSCTTDTVTNAPNGHVYHTTPGEAEPTATPVSVPCDATTYSPGANAVIVDDEDVGAPQNAGGRFPNLQGCLNSTRLSPAGQPQPHASPGFRIVDTSSADVLTDPSSAAAIDVHQLGGGLGGHLFFTHTGPAGQAIEAVALWSATLTADPTYGTVYEAKVFVPDIAATTTRATYEVSDSSDNSTLERTINQNIHSNQWVSLGYYLCGGPSQPTNASSCSLDVRLRTNTPNDDPDQGADIAMDAVAFVPVPPGAYVALGDSYSSGEGAAGTHGTDATYDESTDLPESIDGHGNLCHRSAASWPRVLAAAKGLRIIDLACSGSNTGDITLGTPDSNYTFDERQSDAYFLGVVDTGKAETQFLGDGRLRPLDAPAPTVAPTPTPTPVPTPVPPGSTTTTTTTTTTGPTTTDCGAGPPPYCLIPNPDYAGSTYYGESQQLDLLRALRPSLVTLSIGGNDIGFVDVLTSCYLRAKLEGGSGLCKDNDFTNSFGDLVANRIQSVEPVLENTYRQIIAAVGSATTVYVVDYPAPVVAGTTCSGLNDEDLTWLAPKVAEIDNVIALAARNTGVHLVDVRTAFNGHDMCAGTPYATAPDLNLLTDNTLSQSVMDNWFHPNKAGYQAIAQTVAAQIP